MKQGISTAKQTAQDAACLASKGIRVVLRYYSASAWKRMTPAEGKALAAVGIEIGMFYEDKPTKVGYFTNARGQADGNAAWGYARAMGQPLGSGIYFTVDYDAQAGDLAAITSYFQGVKGALTTAAGGGHGYAIGVYGSGRVCDAIKKTQALAAYSCLAESTGWGGSKTYKDWDIHQSVGKVPLCSFKGPSGSDEAEYEPCQLNDAFGGFTLEPNVIRGAVAVAAEVIDLDIPDAVAVPALGLFAARAKKIAEEQWQFFGKQTYNLAGNAVQVGHKEGEDGWYQQVGRYWLEGTMTHNVDGRNHDHPWSAAFISWVMKSAGAGDRFRYSTQHSVYISQAVRDRLAGRDAAGYWGCRLNEARPVVGDLICWSRQPGIDYDHQNGGNYASHSDLVTSVDNGQITVIGGNFGDSVTERPLALDAAGYLLPTQRGGETLFALMQNRIP